MAKVFFWNQYGLLLAYTLESHGVYRRDYSVTDSDLGRLLSEGYIEISATTARRLYLPD